MNKRFYNMLIAALLCTGILFSEACKKKEEEPEPTPPPTTTPTSTPPQYNPADGAGMMAAVQTVTFTSVLGVPYEFDLGVAVAVFTNDHFTTYVDAGTVAVNGSGNALTKQTNNSYVYNPPTGSTTGIDYSSGIEWNVSGNSGNSVPAITHTVTRSFPGVSDIDNSTATVATNAAYTLTTTTGITGADSIYYTISGPNKTLQRLVGGNTQSVTFTSAEMASLGTGSNAGLLQIAPFNFETEDTGGKKYYYVQEKVISKIVTLQ